MTIWQSSKQLLTADYGYENVGDYVNIKIDDFSVDSKTEYDEENDIVLIGFLDSSKDRREDTQTPSPKLATNAIFEHHSTQLEEQRVVLNKEKKRAIIRLGESHERVISQFYQAACKHRTNLILYEAKRQDRQNCVKLRVM